MDIRRGLDDTIEDVAALYRDTFLEEDLVPLLRALAKEEHIVSLTAWIGQSLAGHILFTLCNHERQALLGPLAVRPNHQRMGVGGSLVKQGFERLKLQDTKIVYVLGDPAYYGRFGFAPERYTQPPYPLPQEWTDAWQSLSLATSEKPETLDLPAPWLVPELWGP